MKTPTVKTIFMSVASSLLVAIAAGTATQVWAAYQWASGMSERVSILETTVSLSVKSIAEDINDIKLDVRSMREKKDK